MTAVLSSAERALAAEVRFVTEAHRVYAGTGCFTVVSDTRPGTRYEIRLHGYAGSAAPIPCKHSAGVLRRGEREGWARWDDGRWVAAGALVEALAAEHRRDVAEGTALLEAM